MIFHDFLWCIVTDQSSLHISEQQASPSVVTGENIAVTVKKAHHHYTSFFSGVYTEFTGEKTLPRALQERQTIFIFGQSGVGKTIVAHHLAGEQAVLMKKNQVLDVFLQKIRRGRWMDDISTCHSLILECPAYLHLRPQILKMLQDVIKLRVNKGLKTIILDSEDASPVRGILQTISIEERATISLRFPVGRGRYRFLAYACRERGLPVKLARQLSEVEPWNYATVFSMMEAKEAQMREIDKKESEEYTSVQ